MSAAILSRRFTRHPLTLLSAVAAGVLVAGGGASAEEIVNQQLEQPSPTEHPSTGPWNVTLGLGGGVTPNFEGASNYHATPIPFGNISYSSRGFAGTEGTEGTDAYATQAGGVDIGLLGVFVGAQGLGVNLLRVGGFRAGALLGYGGGRSESDDSHLNGLGSIDGSIQMGGFARYRWNAFEVRAQIRQAVTHNNGLVGNVGVTYTFRPIDRLSVNIGPQVVFADSSYMEKYFGVTAAQSQASGLRTYSAGGGIKDVGLGMRSTYALDQHWIVFGIANVSEIVGDAANSPIVQSKEQITAGAGLAYHF